MINDIITNASIPAFCVSVIIGSLRKDSISRKFANALKDIAPESLLLEIVEIGSLPLYNEDLETTPPNMEWDIFRHQVRMADAVLFITPEYNRSVSGVLKNAIDVGSAPHGQNVFDGKPGAIISLSVGSMGAFGANHHLRQSLVFLNILTMQQPEAYIGSSETLIDINGKISDERTKLFITNFIDAFAEWIERHTEPHCLSILNS
jgi:chromate reductase